MAERADPRIEGFKEGSIYRDCLFERYEFCNKYIKDKIIMDIPCGVGWGTSLLKGANELIGVDISEEALSFAKETYKEIEFKQGSMTSIPSENLSIEVLICLEGYEHIMW